MAALDQEALQNEMKKKRICRFCLSQDFAKLTNIYMRDTRIKTSAPLPIQIMAIASIEIFSNDGMPCYVCSDCTNIFEYSYQFKQMCKKADNLIRQYPLTGKWSNELEKPKVPDFHKPKNIQTFINHKSRNTNVHHMQINQQQPHVTNKVVAQQSPQLQHKADSLLLPKKILNMAPVTTPEPPIPLRTKVEKIDIDECSITFLDKIENNDELSIDDIQQLMAAEGVGEPEYVNLDSVPVVILDSANVSGKPKVLNKSSVRILNKEAAMDKEPRLSLPKIQKDLDGNTEIVAEILDIDEPYEQEPDPKNAAPIETNVFPCPHCERSFPLLQLRDIHLKNHTRDRKFQCDECDKCFFSKYDLHRHSFIHNGEKPFKCSACNKAFSRSSLLARHEKSHIDIPKYICVHCERSFLSKDDMEKHAERHKVNRPFQCKLCQKSFAFKQGLERHEVIHSRQQPYSCRYCEQSFSTTTKLARHLTAHAGERPYPCKFCKKSYLLSHHLTRHLRSHRNIEDIANLITFMCSSCDGSFETRDELIRHSSIHANEDNLACPLCKEPYESIDALTSHIRDHSDGEAYACEFCDLIFLSAEKLHSHIDTEHATEMEAYIEDDRVQADKQKKAAAEKNPLDISNSSLQQSFTYADDELCPDDPNSSIEVLKEEIKEYIEEQSSKVINQIVIRSSEEDDKHNDENLVEDRNSLLIPMKQRKLNNAKNVVTQHVNKPNTTQQQQQQQPKQSPNLRRKTPAAAATSKTPAREANQPSIHSLLKLPKSLSITKAPPLPNEISPPKPTTIKSGKNIKRSQTSPASSSTKSAMTANTAEVLKSKVVQKKMKVQQITVTKAEAAAMAKEGRIQIKNGKIMLSK